MGLAIFNKSFIVPKNSLLMSPSCIAIYICTRTDRISVNDHIQNSYTWVIKGSLFGHLASIYSPMLSSPPLRHSCLAGYKENTKMSKSCFLSLPSDNPAGMKCGFRNSCPTWPNRASWKGRRWGPAQHSRLPQWRLLPEGSGTEILPGHRPPRKPSTQSGQLAPGTGPFHR